MRRKITGITCRSGCSQNHAIMNRHAASDDRSPFREKIASEAKHQVDAYGAAERHDATFKGVALAQRTEPVDDRRASNCIPVVL